MTYNVHDESRVDENTPMIVFREQLFIFYIKPKRYDPVFDCWSSVRHLRFSPRSAEVVVVRGQIYTIAVNRYKKESTIQRYSVGSCSWEKIFTSHEGCRHYSCVVAAGDCMYVLGGKPSQRRGEKCVAKAERFDTVHNKWEQIADMQQERSCAFGVATQGKIFVAGGEGRGFEQLKSCEVYNISTNEWQFIGSLSVPRVLGSMVCVNGTLYVLGGSRDRKLLSSEYTVESYDPTINEWAKKTSIPVDEVEGKRSFKGCALKLSKGVLGKLI